MIVWPVSRHQQCVPQNQTINHSRYAGIVLTICLSVWSLQVWGALPDTDHSTTDPQLILLEKARSEKSKGHLLSASQSYRDLLKLYPELKDKSYIQNEIGNLNVAVIFSSLRVSQVKNYTIQPNDTLGKIARKFSTTIELIKRRNHLTSDIIIAGQTLSIWVAPFNIIVDKSDNTLVLKTGETVVKVYSVSTGKNNSSPAGAFVIKDRYADPVWFHKGEVVPANDPKNFLGTRWLGFDLPKYGIHGTIEPDLIGQQVSSGCIRMRNEDVQELYDLVSAGTRVIVQE